MRLLASWGNQLAALADPFAWLITGHCCVFSMAASPSRIPFRHGPACLLGAAELKLNAPVGYNACRYATASLLSSAITSTRAAMSVAIASASRCASCPVLSAVCIEPRINVCHCGDDTSIFSTAQLSAWVLFPQRAGNSTCIFRRGLRLFARWEHREQAMPFRQHTTNKKGNPPTIQALSADAGSTRFAQCYTYHIHSRLIQRQSIYRRFCLIDEQRQ